ncbi:hypothetical protein F3J20_31705, partial [Paraburkholderia sp. Cy-641]
AAASGMTLLATQWAGGKAVYPVICRNGHRFTRHGSRLLKGNTTCQQCQADEIRQHFFAVLKQKGFRCSDNAFRGLTARHTFTCGNGHAWTVEARKIVEGTGCPACAAGRRSARMTLPDGLRRLQDTAAAHGGRCLASSYGGMRGAHRWECARGHQWQAVAARIVEGRWCPRCASQRHGENQRDPNGMARLRALAQSYGGECLDEGYSTVAARYRFRCAHGHEWSARAHLVIAGSWCRHCANESKRSTLEQMRAVAHERGGQCLSTVYLGSKARLVWQCSMGHVWESLPGNVIHRGAWCPACFRLRITKKPHLRSRYDVRGGAG